VGDRDFDDELSCFFFGVKCSRWAVEDLGQRSGVVDLVTVVVFVETEDGVKLVTLVCSGASDGTRRAETGRAAAGTVLFSTKLTGAVAAALENRGTHNREDGATRFLDPFC